MKRPKYRIVIQKNNENLTVQEIALVDEPAVEINFLYFNKNEEPKPLYFNEDKMIVAGVLMVPDKLIFRYDEEMGEYDVFFTKEDIENARYNFKKYGLTSEFNNEHTSEKLDVVLIEDFIVEEGDTRYEKYGFKDLPVGTWFGISKVEDFGTWERIKKGELRGYSVEGLFQLKQEFKKVKEDFVIEPTPGETKDEFIGRCISNEVGAGYDEDQAAAICYTKWEDMGLDKLYKLIEEEDFGTKRDLVMEEYEITELTKEVFESFAVSWDFPDWMKPKDTGEGEIKTPSDNSINEQVTEQKRTIPIYYFYDKKPGAQFSGGGIIDEKSRDFCVRLVNQNKYFTKENIDKMTLTAGFDVFQYAGGKNCRHSWFIAIPVIEEFRNWRKNTELYFESYDDYPKAASENAQRALNWVEKNGWGSCGTPVGKARANQLAKGEKISKDTISRMASFERHRANSKVPYDEGCGGLMWDSWGGDEGIEWAQRKLEQIKNEEFEKLNKNEGLDISSIKNKNPKMKKSIRTIQKFVIETELQNGTEVIVNADELAVGAEVSVKVAEEGDVAETDMFQPAPDGEHILADGTVILTEGGLITEIKEAQAAEETTEEVEAGKKKEKMEITEEDLVVIMEALQPKFDEIMGMISELASKLSTSEDTSEEELSKENFNKAKTGLSNIEKLVIVKEKFNIK